MDLNAFSSTKKGMTNFAAVAAGCLTPSTITSAVVVLSSSPPFSAFCQSLALQSRRIGNSYLSPVYFSVSVWEPRLQQVRLSGENDILWGLQFVCETFVKSMNNLDRLSGVTKISGNIRLTHIFI